MSFLSSLVNGKEEKVILFSPLKGKIFYENIPLADAPIELWVAWDNKKGETINFKTDSEGNFFIPEQSKTIKTTPLAQLTIGQKISVTYKGSKKVIWNAGKSNLKLYGELGGEPLEFKCELTSSKVQTFFEPSLVETICTWEEVKI